MISGDIALSSDKAYVHNHLHVVLALAYLTLLACTALIASITVWRRKMKSIASNDHLETHPPSHRLGANPEGEGKFTA
jgi:hypothetical protein